MSQYHVVQTEFEDLECLGKALEEMGMKPEIHQQGAQFTPTYGGGVKNAHIIVRRQNFGGVGDVGFEKTGSKIQIHCDNMDWSGASTRGRLDIPRLRIKYNQQKVKRLISTSAKYTVLGNEQLENGSERVRLRVREF
jgi:hypothetical protein